MDDLLAFDGLIGIEDLAPAPGSILVARSFTAPWQVVFRAWHEPAELARWFGPQGFSVSAFAIDMQEGGGFWMTLRSATGSEQRVGGHYLVIDPPARLTFTWRVESEQGTGEESRVEIVLAPEEGGGTLLQLRQGPLASEELQESHRKAWASTLESLAIRLTEEQL